MKRVYLKTKNDFGCWIFAGKSTRDCHPTAATEKKFAKYFYSRKKAVKWRDRFYQGWIISSK